MTLQFIVPAGFISIPIGATKEEAEREIRSRMPQNDLESNPLLLQNLVDNIHKASQALESSGALYAGTCVRTYGGELSLGTLLVTVAPFAFGDAAVAASGIVRSLISERGEGWEGGVIDTPSGPVAMLSGMNGLRIPVEFSPSGEELTVPMAEMQAFLPIPQGVENQEQCLVCFNFTTPCEDRWEEYCSDIVEILSSITFDRPGPSAPNPSARPETESLPARAPESSVPGAVQPDRDKPATPFG
ncbi:hypothetical protein JCM4914_40960 [Streptomyces platensis subsp. malvinus]